MSYDFQAAIINCDHTQSFERYVVDPNDFMTLHLAASPDRNMRAPINGRALLQLYISGKLVPIDHPIYGYNIVRDKNFVQTSDIFYKVSFSHPVRWFVPLIEITYTTVQSFCLKCSGQGKLNDLKLANSGSLTHVVGTPKLVQRSLKYILTSRCQFYPQFTCPIKDYIGHKFGLDLTDSDISNAVQTALDNFQKVQAAQRTIQTLDPLEILKAVTSVTAQQDPNDPTVVRIAAMVSSYGSSTAAPLAFTLKSNKSLIGQQGQ